MAKKEYSTVNQWIKKYESLIRHLNTEIQTLTTKLSDARGHTTSLHQTLSSYTKPDASGPVIDLFELKLNQNKEDYHAIFQALDQAILDLEEKKKDASKKLTTLYGYQEKENTQDRVFQSWEIIL